MKRMYEEAGVALVPNTIDRNIACTVVLLVLLNIEQYNKAQNLECHDKVAGHQFARHVLVAQRLIAQPGVAAGQHLLRSVKSNISLYVCTDLHLQRNEQQGEDPLVGGRYVHECELQPKVSHVDSLLSHEHDK